MFTSGLFFLAQKVEKLLAKNVQNEGVAKRDFGNPSFLFMNQAPT